MYSNLYFSMNSTQTFTLINPIFTVIKLNIDLLSSNAADCCLDTGQLLEINSSLCETKMKIFFLSNIFHNSHIVTSISKI